MFAQATRVAVALCVAAALLAGAAEAIGFELEEGKRKCFSEEFSMNASVQLELVVTDGQGEMSVDFSILELPARNVVYSVAALDAVKHTLVATAGTYEMCFEDKERAKTLARSARFRVSRRVALEVTVLEAGALPEHRELAKQAQLDSVVAAVGALEARVNSIVGEVDAAKAREAQLAAAAALTGSYMLLFGLLAGSLTLATGAYTAAVLHRGLRHHKII